MNKILLILLLGLSLFVTTKTSYAQTNQINQTLEGKITKITESVIDETSNTALKEFEVKITKGFLKDETVTIENQFVESIKKANYEVGDKVLINYTYSEEMGKDYQIVDYVRYPQLFWIFILFLLVVIIGSGVLGLKSIIGLVYSFSIVIFVLLPIIAKGVDPLLVVIPGVFLIAPVTFYLSHGINRKTTIALIGTFIALLFTSILSLLAVDWAELSGFATDDALFLSFLNSQVNIKSLLLTGIIISSLGVLDDATVAQASIVNQLKKSNPKLEGMKLYKMAMDVGRDHISSTVNTLVLVYAGAALPLLLLFQNNADSFTSILNYEPVAEEIVKILVSSIGLIMSIPITTALAARFVKPQLEHEEQDHIHTH